MPTTPTLAATLIAAALLLTGCGSDAITDASGEASTTLDVTGADRIEFQPDAFTVPAGEEVSISLMAGDAVEHDFVIEGAADVSATGEDGHGEAGHDIPPDDLAVVHADAGQTARGTFTIDEPETYTVYCSVPGHRQSGMEATLTVVADS